MKDDANRVGQASPAEDVESSIGTTEVEDKEVIPQPTPENFIGRVLSKTTTRVSVDPGPPPDGGRRAWTQAVMGHLVVFNVWGYINSFGVFQAYHVSNLHRAPSDISWVGSVQIFLLFFIGTFSGRATDYGLFRLTFLIGSILFLLGVFMTSLSTTYLQLFLAQGVCTGIGQGLLFCPALSLLSTYFTKNRAVAISIAASGTATGGIVFPVIVQQLLPKIGFPWTVRIIAFVMLAVQIVTFTFLRTRLPPRKSGALVEWAAFTELPYLLFSIGMFFCFWGLYVAFYYLPSFGRDILGITYKDSISNLLILNGVGLFGRIFPAFLADKFFGPLNTLIPVMAAAALLLYCWSAISTPGGLTAFSVFYGLFGAAIQALFPATLASLTTDIKKAGVRIGMVFSVVSFSSLTGPPMAGALISDRHGSYLYAQMFAATVMVVGCLTCLASRVTQLGWRKGRV
ncbi:uncharacterized protein KY384_006104 [Bacidia gigantensis]|uniref:uncharacterized protein n=1 Tax=Bacidia gigantensis TaxID=2732470 RepID=UPI001D04CF16|nr:uncharacterized protein KY384_006104 [Bacidia gigantensis]KAG8529467.1 hypothetical protein KY384_006104 [Bacidia gigantensis]